MTGFTVEHIPKTLAPNETIDSAPKDFVVMVSWTLLYYNLQQICHPPYFICLRNKNLINMMKSYVDDGSLTYCNFSSPNYFLFHKKWIFLYYHRHCIILFYEVCDFCQCSKNLQEYLVNNVMVGSRHSSNSFSLFYRNIIFKLSFNKFFEQETQFMPDMEKILLGTT